MNILVVGTIFPAPIKSKKRENDFQFITADLHESYYGDVKYYFIYVVPYTNWLLANLSPKWKEYYQLKNMRSYSYDQHIVEIVWYPQFRSDRIIRNFLGTITFYSLKKRLKKIIKKNDIDLVHTQDILHSGILVHKISKYFNIPYIVTTRGPRNRREMDNYPDKIVTDAEASFNLNKHELEIAKAYNKKSYLVPHGLNEQFINREKVYDIQKKTPLKIVTLCRLLDWKNIDKVLYALKHSKIDFIYHIYGDGPDLERLRSILNELHLSNQVTFKGFIPYENVAATLSKYELFVLPSYVESFGRVFFEAMACGLPVIGAKGCGIDGYIAEGEHGFLVNHNDIKEITKYLELFYKNRYLIEEMGLKAKSFSAEFSWENVIRKIDSIYRKSM